MKIRNIFPYMGQKLNILDWVISTFPPHKRYIEVFGGTGVVLANKQRVDLEVYNDANAFLSNLMLVVSNKDSFNELLDIIVKLPNDENIFNHFAKTIELKQMPDVDCAVKYFYLMSLCAYGNMDAWKIDTNSHCHGRWINDDRVKHLIALAKRYQGVLITSRNYDVIINNYKKYPDTLFYCDPPYYSTEYAYDMWGTFTENDHIKLRDLLKSISGKFIVSYEEHEEVRKLYSDFYFIEKGKFRQGQNKPGEKSHYKLEIMITNFKPTSVMLF